jgi:hypothetical protein
MDDGIDRVLSQCASQGVPIGDVGPNEGQLADGGGVALTEVVVDLATMPRCR